MPSGMFEGSFLENFVIMINRIKYKAAKMTSP